MGDNGTQLFGALVSVLNVVVTAGAAFTGAWCTYWLQKRNERDQTESRLTGNLILLQAEINLIAARLGRVPAVFEEMKKHFVKGRNVSATFHYPEQSLVKVRYDLAFISHRPALTQHLSELLVLLDNLKATVENIIVVLDKRPPEVTLEVFLRSREPAFQLSLTQMKEAQELVSKVSAEIEALKNERAQSAHFFD